MIIVFSDEKIADGKILENGFISLVNVCNWFFSFGLFIRAIKIFDDMILIRIIMLYFLEENSKETGPKIKIGLGK